jgi:hypothetical protein
MRGAMNGFERIERDGTLILVRPEWKAALLDDLLQGFAGVPNELRRSYAHGRRPHFSYLPKGAPARVFVRRASRGGLIGTLLGGLYVGSGRPLRELRAAESARAAGVNVPEPLAIAAVRTFGPFHRLIVVSREIEGAEDLLSLSGRLSSARKRELLARVADAMRRLHEAGVYHADLTMKNILVADSGVYIIDLDKARLPGTRTADLDVQNLARLNRSVEKLLGKGGWISRTDKLRFLRRYLGGRERVRELAGRCAQGLWAHRLWWAVGGRA